MPPLHYCLLVIQPPINDTQLEWCNGRRVTYSSSSECRGAARHGAHRIATIIWHLDTWLTQDQRTRTSLQSGYTWSYPSLTRSPPGHRPRSPGHIHLSPGHHPVTSNSHPVTTRSHPTLTWSPPGIIQLSPSHHPVSSGCHPVSSCCYPVSSLFQGRPLQAMAEQEGAAIALLKRAVELDVARWVARWL